MMTVLMGVWCMASASMARTWTLEDCIQYAMDNNITLQKAGVTRQTAEETRLQSHSQLFPSLDFSTAQSVTYKPYMPTTQATVVDGQVQPNNTRKTYYTGTYGVNARWTVWNGNRNHNQVKINELAEQQAEMDSVKQARTIEEQISQLYVQILYSKEAVEVHRASLEMAKVNEERGKNMYEVGSISKADYSQLTAQRATDEYNLVHAESDVRNLTRQLKALLQITSQEAFDVVPLSYTEAMALASIPTMESVYGAALENRPEMKKAHLAVQSADIQKKVASAQRLPTVAMTASIGANTNSNNANDWNIQMRNNLTGQAGVTITVPLLDQRATRTAKNKATLQRQTALLDIRQQETTLYSTIENYWIQAQNSQAQYKAAKVSSQSAHDSYELLSEQFALGLKNITQLQEGKARLLNAEQSELQSKYTSILNIKMLEFYKK
jgi:outer membrane protein